MYYLSVAAVLLLSFVIYQIYTITKIRRIPPGTSLPPGLTRTLSLPLSRAFSED